MCSFKTDGCLESQDFLEVGLTAFSLDSQLRMKENAGSPVPLTTYSTAIPKAVAVVMERSTPYQHSPPIAASGQENPEEGPVVENEGEYLRLGNRPPLSLVRSASSVSPRLLTMLALSVIFSGRKIRLRQKPANEYLLLPPRGRVREVWRCETRWSECQKSKGTILADVSNCHPPAWILLPSSSVLPSFPNLICVLLFRSSKEYVTHLSNLKRWLQLKQLSRFGLLAFAHSWHGDFLLDYWSTFCWKLIVILRRMYGGYNLS